MSDIAHSTITGSLDTAAKFFRTILKAGVSLEQLMLPVDNRTARANFVAFMKAGCPKLSTTELASNPAPAPKPSLLEPVTTVEVEGIDEFVASGKFRKGETIDGVKIWSLGGNFKTNFVGKTEKDIAPATLRIQKLKKASIDTPIRNDIGADNEETALGQFWELLKKQGQGQAGALLVNGWANIFYIRDQNGTLWAVSARWLSGCGWLVEASSVTFPVEWSAGRQVVSR
jgi:hypothetical protein